MSAARKLPPVNPRRVLSADGTRAYVAQAGGGMQRVGRLTRGEQEYLAWLAERRVRDDRERPA